MNSDIRQPTFISLLALGYALHALEEGDFCWRDVKIQTMDTKEIVFNKTKWKPPTTYSYMSIWSYIKSTTNQKWECIFFLSRLIIEYISTVSTLSINNPLVSVFEGTVYKVHIRFSLVTIKTPNHDWRFLLLLIWTMKLLFLQMLSRIFFTFAHHMIFLQSGLGQVYDLFQYVLLLGQVE